MDAMMIEQGGLRCDQLTPDILFGMRLDLPLGYQYNSGSVRGGYEGLSTSMNTMDQIANVMLNDGSVDLDVIYGHMPQTSSENANINQHAIEMEYAQSLQHLNADLSQLDLIHQQRYSPLGIGGAYGKEIGVSREHRFQSGFANIANHCWPQDALERSIMMPYQNFLKSIDGDIGSISALDMQSNVKMLNGITETTECGEGALRMLASSASKYDPSGAVIPISPGPQERQERASPDIEVNGAFDNQSHYVYPFNEENGLSGVPYMYDQDVMSDNGGVRNLSMARSIPNLDTAPYNAYIPSAPDSTLSASEGVKDIAPSVHVSRQKCQDAQSLPESPQFLASSPGGSPVMLGSITASDTKVIPSSLEAGVERCIKKCRSPVAAAIRTMSSPGVNARLSCLSLRQRRKNVSYSRISNPKVSRSYKVKLSLRNPKINLEFTKSQSGDTLACPHPGCSKIFPKLYNLKSHMVCHSGDRPHVCSLCSKAFARKHDLQRHLRTIHSEHRPFECDMCFETFPRADALRRHKIVERSAVQGLDKKRQYPACSARKISTDFQAQQRYSTQVQGEPNRPLCSVLLES